MIRFVEAYVKAYFPLEILTISKRIYYIAVWNFSLTVGKLLEFVGKYSGNSD